MRYSNIKYVRIKFETKIKALFEKCKHVIYFINDKQMKYSAVCCS